MGSNDFIFSQGPSTALVLFLISYVFVVFLVSALLGLGWALDAFSTSSSWPQPQRYGRLFSFSFLVLLSTLGGFPPFFLLGPKLAIFSWLITLGAWGSILLACGILLLGWYVYWQGASGLFENSSYAIRPSRKLTRGGAVLLLTTLTLPFALSGSLLDLLTLAFWLI